MVKAYGTESPLWIQAEKRQPGVRGDSFYQGVADKGDSHSIAGKMIGGGLLVQLQHRIRRKSLTVKKGVGPAARIVARP